MQPILQLGSGLSLWVGSTGGSYLYPCVMATATYTSVSSTSPPCVLGTTAVKFQNAGMGWNHVVFTANYNPANAAATYTLWVNGALNAIASPGSLANVSSTYYPANFAVDMVSPASGSVVGNTFADFQVYVNTDLSAVDMGVRNLYRGATVATAASNSTTTVCAGGANDGYGQYDSFYPNTGTATLALTTRNAVNNARSRWPGAPPLYACPSVAPLYRYIGGATSLYALNATAVTANASGYFSLFVNGMPAATPFTTPTTALTGGSLVGAISGNTKSVGRYIADLQIYNLDLSNSASALYWGLGCASADASAPAAAKTVTSAYSASRKSAPFGANGPPFLYTCSDTNPLHWFGAGGSAPGTAPTAISAMTNAGTSSGNGTAYAAYSPYAGYVSSLGGVLVNEANGEFRAPGTLYGSFGSVATGMWISVPWTASAATPMYPVVSLGNGLALFIGVSSVDGATSQLALVACINAYGGTAYAQQTNTSVTNAANVTSCASVSSSYMFKKPVVLQTSPSAWTHIAFAVQRNASASTFNTNASPVGYSFYINGVTAGFCPPGVASCTLPDSSLVYGSASLPVVAASVGAWTPQQLTGSFLGGIVVGDLQVYASNGVFTPASLFTGDACTGTTTTLQSNVLAISNIFNGPLKGPTAPYTSAGIPFSYSCMDIPPLSSLASLRGAANSSDLYTVSTTNSGAMYGVAPYTSNIAFNATAGGWTPTNNVAGWAAQGCWNLTNTTGPFWYSPTVSRGAITVNMNGTTAANCVAYAAANGYTSAAVYNGGVCVACTNCAWGTPAASGASCGIAAPACDPYCGSSTFGLVFTSGPAPPTAATAPPPPTLLGAAPPPPALGSSLSSQPLQSLPSFFLAPKTNLVNTAWSTSPWINNGVFVEAWVKNAGYTNSSDGYQQIMQLGNGLSLSGQLAANNGLSLCVTGYHPYDIFLSPSSCSSSTGAYLSASAVTVYPAANANGWIHLTWAAKYSPALGGTGYYLYANGQLVASQSPAGTSAGTLLPFTAYYDGSLQRIGFMFQVSDFNGKLFFGELQVYSVSGGDDNSNNAASLYVGGKCTDFTNKYASLNPVLNTATYAEEADNTHRYFFGAGNALGVVTAWNATTVADTHTGNATTWAPVYGSLNPYVNTFGLPDVGAILDGPNAYLELGPRDYGLVAINATDGLSATAPGVSFSFWMTRTAAALGSQGNATRLLTVIGNTYDDYNYTIALAPRAGPTYHTVDVSWPACQGDAAFVSTLPTGTLNTAGTHHIAVSHSATSAVQVFVDGLPAAYRSQAASGLLCDLAFSTWPAQFSASNFSIGSSGSADAGTFVLVDFVVHARALSSADASAIWAAGPPAASDAVLPPPPPVAAPTTVVYNLPKMAACSAAPPIHRYGDFSATVAPFTGGVLQDTNTTQPWPGVWRSNATPATVPANSFITLGNLTTYYSANAYVDFGPQTFTGTGLSVGFLVSNTAVANSGCSVSANYSSASASAAGAPASYALFDVGGYSVYSVVNSCAAGFTNGVPNAATIVTSPGGGSSSFQGAGTARSPLLPMINERYTFVTFGPSVARIYTNGQLWGTFPMVQYSGGVFAAPSVRFVGGEMNNGGSMLSITIHDLQMYDRELQPGDVAALSRGVSFSC